ncbi:gliding motility-associated ABC transporter ATP-binding subunit GldA [Polaribacter reichenbachii]|uniref:Gliding motility-associated ABC transporter ATP-binding subunit GldA n=1 Tax=Polaribacter reichenbachii TaxID=996801 RepID=A0A1B8U6R3_9FLAO|nr:gliding motility-associated ABC transporter ATP-binding subunit GldA [Polaribacter reichenbachii]APZ46305.1 gliding motility-associated ABC transporter ATP-binding subunit GldA [Polaribacter reichenbachii]AUC20168.1 gliding motility-associated ABC transporter ATP-binding subunit GldA [Polaribacter reichenbachii]OBY67573.1 gliding motility-associated ABC transporter ATP-binding subunit GldA [Polaribacter reichenbachii]
MSIKVASITKTYKTQKALNNISFSADKGQIIGFLGPNGAGKSTMMKILTGFVKPNSGEVLVDDIDVLQNPLAAQKTIGYLPEHNPLYSDMYVREYLQFQAAIFKVDKNQIEACIKKVGLTAEAHKKIHQLSKGYQQRVGLAAAILHNPSVLILDEPTTGLDPNQLIEIRALISELGKEKTVLFSTHIMQEVEAVCDRVIIIKKGEILVDKNLADLKENKQQTIIVTFDYKIEEQFINRLPNVVSYKNNYDNTWYITFESEEDMRSKIFDFAQENGLKILGLNTENKNLETLFREVTQ